jgi:hypothetical protein
MEDKQHLVIFDYAGRWLSYHLGIPYQATVRYPEIAHKALMEQHCKPSKIKVLVNSLNTVGNHKLLGK